jgi:adenylate cyclase
MDDAHAYKAVVSALEMVHRKDEMKEEFKRLGLPEIEIGIGMNTGWVNVGDMGSEYRRSYTVLGDAVNLASRIESLTKYYGVHLLVGEGTQQAVLQECHVEQKPEILFRHVDRVKVKGKTEAVDLYEPVNLFSEASSDVCYEVQTFNEAHKCYHHQRWDDAETLLQQLKAKKSDVKLYTLFLDRIADFRKNPPAAGWDGSIVMTEK